VTDLVYPAGDGVVQDAGDEEGLHVPRLNVQLSGYEGDLYPSVGTNQLYQHLCSEVRYNSKRFNRKTVLMLHGVPDLRIRNLKYGPVSASDYG
jgi:hypothetical protein